MKTLTNLLEDAAATPVTKPQRNTIRSSLKEMRGLVANTINTTVGLANETLEIANDIVSAIPVIIQGSREAITLTGLFSRAIALNSILTEEQITAYDKLSPEQRVIFRKQLTEMGGANLVAALTELFQEEDTNHKSTKAEG